MKLTLEETHHLTREQCLDLCYAIEAVYPAIVAGTFEEVATELEGRLCDWFVYRGGSHVAIHLTKNDWRRCALLTA
jgi:hypothetical protein